MADVNEDIVKNLSKLSRIEVKDEEIPNLLATLKQVIGYFDQLHEVDVSDLSPYSHVEEQGIGFLREDAIDNSLKHDRFIANTPEHVGGMVRVPPLFKHS